MVNIATASIILPVQTAKLVGGAVTNGSPTQGAAIDGGADLWKLLFDTTTAEGAVWQFRMPTNFSSTLVSKIQYAMTSAVSAATVAFDIAIWAIADGEDIDTPSFDTVTSTGAITVPATPAGKLDTISTDLTNEDSIAAGELCVVQLSRDVALDDGAGDAEVVSFSLDYTTT